MVDLAWLLQAAGCPGGTGLAAAAHKGYWPCCYRPQVDLGVLAWLLQAPGWSGVLAWLLQAAGLPGVLAWLLQPTWGGTGMAATALNIAWGYWPGCYRP